MTKGAKEKNTLLTIHQKRVLELIASEDYFTTRFYFTGGTALSEFYLRHRLSEDLDFFSEYQEINPSAITRFIELHAKKLEIEKFDTRNVFGLWTFFLTFSDRETLKVDFSFYPFPRIEKGMKLPAPRAQGILSGILP